MALMRPVYSESQLRELEKFSRAEVLFYTACRAQLPDTVLVIHSSGFAQRSKDGLQVGEIDFVLAFADAGLMVVEVKGGNISRDNISGKWSSTGNNGKNEIKNPVDQALKQRYALQKIIDGHPKWKEWFGGRIIYAPAVFFPNVKAHGLVSFQNAFADQVSFGGLEDLGRLTQWTARVNEFWSRAKGTQTLGPSGLKLVEEILYPSIELSSDAIGSLGRLWAPGEQPPTMPPPNDGITSQPTKSWGELLRHVSQDSQSPPFVIKKRDGAIELTREWNPQLLAFIWTKESRGDLSFLSDWEAELLRRVTKAGVKKRVRWIDMVSVSSPQHMGDLPKEKQPCSQSKVRTYDAGPTLDVWQCMHPRVEGHPQSHPFVAQRSYLQLVRSVLIALEDFHFRGFIHCDLHQGNIALPVKGITTPQYRADRGEHVELEPDWDETRIIDLDFSASRSIAPPIRLPHDLTKFPLGASRMSDHLRLRLAAIDDWLADSGQLDRSYDPEFWAQPSNSSYLECLERLDWREDLHQLGYLLREIRDSWGGAKHVVTTGNNKTANIFITTFPEELMAWGSSQQIAWNPITRANSVEAPVELPHADYIARIDRLLRQLSELPKAIVLYRQDHDPQYDPALDAQRRAKTDHTVTEHYAKPNNDTPINTASGRHSKITMREFEKGISASTRSHWQKPQVLLPIGMGALILVTVLVGQTSLGVLSDSFRGVEPASVASGRGADILQADQAIPKKEIAEPQGSQVTRDDNSQNRKDSLEPLGQVDAMQQSRNAELERRRLVERKEPETRQLRTRFGVDTLPSGVPLVALRLNSIDGESSLLADHLQKSTNIGLVLGPTSSLGKEISDAIVAGRIQDIKSAGVLDRTPKVRVLSLAASCRTAESMAGVVVCSAAIDEMSLVANSDRVLRGKYNIEKPGVSRSDALEQIAIQLAKEI